MNSRRTARFRDLDDQLPRHIQLQADRAVDRFQSDSQHPALRLKRVHTTEPIVSARISRNYRALARAEGETYIWFWIGPHAEYERILGQR